MNAMCGIRQIYGGIPCGDMTPFQGLVAIGLFVTQGYTLCK